MKFLVAEFFFVLRTIVLAEKYLRDIRFVYRIHLTTCICIKLTPFFLNKTQIDYKLGLLVTYTLLMTLFYNPIL